VVDENWPLTRQAVLGMIPLPLRVLIAPIARRGVRRQLAGHGMGLHTADEIHAIGAKDIGAVADLLGDKPFLLGGTATEIDAVAYGLLANIMLVPVKSPVKDAALRREPRRLCGAHPNAVLLISEETQHGPIHGGLPVRQRPNCGVGTPVPGRPLSLSRLPQAPRRAFSRFCDLP
jgi:hypothetical protein